MNTDLYYGLLLARQQEAYYRSREFEHRIALAGLRRRKPARRHVAALARRMAATFRRTVRADRPARAAKGVRARQPGISA